MKNLCSGFEYKVRFFPRTKWLAKKSNPAF